MPKVLFVVTEDWYFCSHRLSLALAAKQAGFDVAVATRVVRHAKQIEEAGIRLIPLRWMRRSSLNPLREAASFAELLALYRRERPDLVHQVAIKPVLYGSFAARMANISGRVNALGGLGFVFSSTRLLARALRILLRPFLKAVFRDPCSRLILQNQGDVSFLSNLFEDGVSGIRMIRGVGVDLNKFAIGKPETGVPIIMLAGRLLWDKGVGEFVDAARILCRQGLKARFVLVGQPDMENPASVATKQLRDWQASGLIEWWGYSSDMPSDLARASVVCLPSYYGEGVPLVLIEAMACGKPIVTTDMPGCRELVPDSCNGLLVPFRDSVALAEAIGRLIRDSDLRERMGREGRKLVVEEYALPRIIAETLSVYRELLRR